MRIAIEGEEFDVDPGRIKFGEAKRIEQVTGMTFGEWGKALQAGSVTALQALVWVLKRRTHPDVRIDDIDDLEFGQVELAGPEMAADGPPRPAGADPTRRASKRPVSTSS